MSRVMRCGLIALVVLSSSAVFVSGLQAHDCEDLNEDGQIDQETECERTPSYGGWRPNWVPLFDVPDREDDTDGQQEGESPTDDSRRSHQRWRDEYGCLDPFCIWANPNISATGEPRSLHAGVAADHCWTEGFHECEDHITGSESTHDGHGGTIYADVCLAEDKHYYDEKVETGCTDRNDSEIGFVIVDHLDCTFGCQDEYHIIRPTDPAYTQAQMEESAEDTQYIVDHPDDWLCGYDSYGSNCPLPDSEP
jgi:hypothetical protein